jgi:hypothetical protein
VSFLKRVENVLFPCMHAGKVSRERLLEMCQFVSIEADFCKMYFILLYNSKGTMTYIGLREKWHLSHNILQIGLVTCLIGSD